jgi:hypothetical protein
MFLQNCKCTFSIDSLFSKPHTSEAYNKIGLTKESQNQRFKIKGQNIEIIDSYCYLGMLFNYNGNFCTVRKKITEQAHKALFAVSEKLEI